MTATYDDAHERAFFARHDADPLGVYLVTIFPQERNGIFTTKAAAEAWTATFPDDCSALYCPYVLNEPDYGNIPKSQQQ